MYTCDTYTQSGKNWEVMKDERDTNLIRDIATSRSPGYVIVRHRRSRTLLQSGGAMADYSPMKVALSGCKKRNELGVFKNKLTAEECVAKCSNTKKCVSVEMEGWGGPGDTAKLSRCQLSKSCTKEQLNLQRLVADGWNAWYKTEVDADDTTFPGFEKATAPLQGCGSGDSKDLGVFKKVTAAQCAAKCTADRLCVSMKLRFYKPKKDNSKLKECQLSSTCTASAASAKPRFTPGTYIGGRIFPPVDEWTGWYFNGVRPPPSPEAPKPPPEPVNEAEIDCELRDDYNDPEELPALRLAHIKIKLPKEVSKRKDNKEFGEVYVACSVNERSGGASSESLSSSASSRRLLEGSLGAKKNPYSKWSKEKRIATRWPGDETKGDGCPFKIDREAAARGLSFHMVSLASAPCIVFSLFAPPNPARGFTNNDTPVCFVCCC